ncbi:hypothetical protein QCA50_004956 [Cerrena zonata]|uniref:Uncharacterized protein n=1 Tax=Cerrena zonata TaxID=2478898 RepID=A0AAW0GNT8_9APHY
MPELTKSTPSPDLLVAQLKIRYNGRLAEYFRLILNDSVTRAQVFSEECARRVLRRLGIVGYKIHEARYVSGGITAFGLSVARKGEDSTRIAALFYPDGDSLAIDFPKILREENIKGIHYSDQSFNSTIFCQGYHNLPREKLKIVKQIVQPKITSVALSSPTSHAATARAKPSPPATKHSRTSQAGPSKRSLKIRRDPIIPKPARLKRSSDKETPLSPSAQLAHPRSKQTPALVQVDKDKPSLKRKSSNASRECAPSNKKLKGLNPPLARNTILEQVAFRTPQVSTVVVRDSDAFNRELVKQEEKAVANLHVESLIRILDDPLKGKDKDNYRLIQRLQTLETDHLRTQELMLQYLSDATRLAQEKCYMMDEQKLLIGEVESLRGKCAATKVDFDRTSAELQTERSTADAYRATTAQNLKELQDRLERQDRSRKYWEDQAHLARAGQEQAESISMETVEEHSKLMQSFSELERQLHAVRRENSRLQQLLSTGGTGSVEAVAVPAVLEAFSQINQLSDATSR